MKLESKPIITFTEQEYTIFNMACMMLDDLINGDYRLSFETIMGDDVNLDILFGWFATLTDYVEDHRE